MIVYCKCLSIFFPFVAFGILRDWFVEEQGRKKGVGRISFFLQVIPHFVVESENGRVEKLNAVF